MKLISKNLIRIVTILTFLSSIVLISVSSHIISLNSIFNTSIKPASDAPHSTTCNTCHITHTSPGISLTSVHGNANLCMSCHNPVGAANLKPFSNSDIAIPGISGTSHAWDKPSANVIYGANLTTNSEMLLRVINDTIICSTCHNQHSQTYTPFLRSSNSGDALCKNCHLIRDVGRYIDDPLNNKGSHPVGLIYNGADSKLRSSPGGSVILVDGKIECSGCHKVHYSAINDGNLLREANGNTLCTECHTYGTHNSMSCLDCHQTHNPNKTNIYMIKDVITTPNSGNKNVIFSAETGTNSFADGNATYDGICEVCHTTTQHFRNDGTAPDQNHTSSGGPMNGQNCTSCHPHSSNFSPSGGSCSSCHVSNFPNWGTTDGHYAHTVKYSFACNTCHYQYGSGGASEGSHPNGGSAEVNFDPLGLATRNGSDSNTPTWDGTSCSNVYCHSDGRSAYRGTDGTDTWSGTIGPQTATYATVSWTSSITTCTSCHSATGNMNSPYTINTPGLADPLPPATGSHRRGAHTSNTQELSGNGWAAVNCFWCHNTDSGNSTPTMNQGTYGTSFHVDGETYFSPRSYVDGGTMVNATVSSGGSFSYSKLGSKAHCSQGKTCW